MSWIDISQTLKEKMDVWPGDTHFKYDTTMSIEEGDSVNVGTITMSSHTGTHMDAPFHYDTNGLKLHELPLEYFHGETLVMDVLGKKVIEVDDVKGIDFKGVKKVLFKTRQNGPASYDDFTILSPQLATYLSEKNIHLVGVDSPSVDPLTSKELKAHHALKEANIFILEGLVLNEVKQGFYELFAFPLKIEDADGSPVRAVLKDNKRT
ncbi:arylformamidase [Bacillus shivajii]|uniref:arylformamidase n=1 Tax=Bacillus shivajii TaxID=1983719 RepID=UPI001CFB7972|nr:arylformamidase [Bacillus shivajii]UCZ54836.1 arylformamidase [Bacillus shivajii]